MDTITKAGDADISSIVELLNLTYRGETSANGWTTEADIIKGEIRTDSETILALMNAEDSIFLKCTDGDGLLVGCVHLQKKGHRMYLGMLSVKPGLQGKGIGKNFLHEAEIQAAKYGCRAVYMQVITERTELTNWYLRHGYSETGERKAFDVDEKYGVPVKPLEFMFLEKVIAH